MVRIGEKMSELVDLDKLVYDTRGDVFEDHIAFALLKPLDIGRLFYVKLRTAIDESLDVEVYWDHFSNSITGMVAGRQVALFIDGPMARSDKVVWVDQTVEMIQEGVKRFLLE